MKTVDKYLFQYTNKDTRIDVILMPLLLLTRNKCMDYGATDIFLDYHSDFSWISYKLN